LQAGLVPGLPSTDAIAPTSVITAPSANQRFTAGAAVTITGTATDAGGGVVAGVEVSTDGGRTWHKAAGTTSWSYTWIPDSAGPATILSRATDDSLNTERPSAGVPVTVSFQATSTTGLVAAYNFNQGNGSTLTDVSGSGHNGTIANGTWTTGLFGGALSFNGNNTTVTIPNSASLQLTTGMTLEAWVYPTANSLASPVIVKQESGGLDYGLYASDGTTLHAVAATHNSTAPTSGADSLLGNAVLPLNTWSHLAATYDGSTLRFYINGTLATSQTFNYSLLTGTGALVLGGDSAGNNYQGLMDEVRIYNRALNQGEIRSDMNTPFGGALESTAPTVSLTGPANGATVSGITTVSATASDDVFVKSVQFQVNGGNVGVPVTRAPYSFAWDSRAVANGSYVLTALAADMAGNTTVSSSVSVTVNNPPDTTPPTVRVTGPADGSLLSGTVALQAFASDMVGVQSVQFQLDGTNAGPAVTAAPYRLSFDTRSVLDGCHSLTAVATDIAGNVTTSSAVSVTIDNQPPMVASETPVSGATSVSTAAGVTASFNKPIQPATLSFVLKDAAGNTVPAAVTYNPSWNSATLAPNFALVPSATYTATVSGATDLNGLVMSGPVTWSFTTAGTLTGATIFGNAATPAVAAANDGSAIEVGVKFKSDVAGAVTGLRFYKGTGNTGSHVGHLWDSTGTLMGTATFSGETASGWQQVSFSSPVAISANTVYVASYYAPNGAYAVTSGYFASAGADTPPLHALANGVSGGDGVYQYGTSGFPTQSYGATNYWVDVLFNASAAGTAPTVTAEAPAANATGVSTSTTVTATFSESVQSNTISFTLTDPNNTTVGASVSYNDTTHTATLTPSGALATNSTYTATVSGAIDAQGHAMAAPVTWSFSTVTSAVSGNTIWAGSVTPAVASANDAAAIELGVKFRSDVAGSILGLRFYKGAANTGTHVGHLWTSTGTLLDTATFTGEAASGWQQVSLSSPVPISPNTTYIASYYAPNGGYSANSGYFTSAGADSPPLHALANGVDGGNGVYLYGSGGGFPGSSYSSTNYWVDVVFNPSSTGTPPTVTAETPAAGATGVPTSTTVTATFSKAVQQSTINFVLQDALNNPVAATMTYNAATLTATLTPSASLAPSTTYTATVSGATDTAGDVMTSPFSWSFTTAPAGSTTTIWSATALPTIPSVNDPNAIEVGVRLESDVAGTMTGLRFYKGASNTGTHIGHLWTSTGTLLATATFASETASGWQQVNFSSPVAISANTMYIASYYAPNGGYAATPAYFASVGADNPPLHALANGVGGPDGLYLYGTGGGFPSNSYNATNYWVDVVFSPSATSTPPAVTTETPSAGATGVPLATTVTAAFSEPVQASTINFVLTDPSNHTVPATVTYNASTQTATLTPSAALAASTTYTATVSGAKDFNGNLMASPVSWSFMTTTAASYSIWSASATPAVASANDTSAIELGVKFQADVAGTVTGLSFYKGASNTGTHVGHLWSGTGTLLATATFTNETATGWQKVTFSSPVAIAAGTVYHASYYAPNGGYAVDSGYFASAGANNVPLHALANGVSGGNGVYLYGTGGGFPSNSYNAANYWVDVAFTPSSSSILAVVGQSPAGGTTGVPTGTGVTATFNEQVQAGTISFVLKDPSGNMLPATISYNSTTLTATLIPNAPLLPMTIYTTTVSGALDQSGNAMAPVTWKFRTTGIWKQTTVADFSSGTLNGTTVTNTAGGEVQLAAGFTDDFPGSSLSTSWVSNPWQPGGGVTVANSIASVAGTEVLSTQTFIDIAVQASVNFAAAPYQHFGLATDFAAIAGNSWAVFSTMGSSNTLYARVNANGTETVVSLGALPAGLHTYLVQPMAVGYQFYVDGVLQTTIAASFQASTPLKIGFSAYLTSGGTLQVDWVKQLGGTFTSSVFNAGGAATWGTASWTASQPAGTTMIVLTRSGNSATPDSTWSNWAVVTNGGAVASPGSQFLQYMVMFITTDPSLTPILDDITFTWNLVAGIGGG
jgi:hypothetical protein